jgi:transforming growth factor-beta-induced protein
MKRFMVPIIAVLVIAVGVFFVSCDNDGGGGALQNVLEIAQGNAELASLVNIIEYADQYDPFDPDIAGTLADGTETITGFTPNNDAFVAVFGDNDSDGVVELEDIQDFRDDNSYTDAELGNGLTDVLSYHVIYGVKLMAADVVAADGSSIGPTDAGVNLNVTVAGSDVTLDPADGTTGADIVQTDIEASNGVAHVIDAVMGLP